MHNRLIKIMTELGYSPDQNGMCYGVASMAAQAALVDELNVFFDRLKKIENLNASQLSQFIQQLKSSDFTQLTAEKKEQAVDMLAFFDGVKTHADISDVSHLFFESGKQKKIQQNFVMSAKQVGSLLLEKENICKVTEFILGLTREELKHYLQQLKYLCDERKALKLIFMLFANKHAIEMSYDLTTKKIIIVDANQLENIGRYQQVHSKKDDINVAVDTLFKGFFLNNAETLLLKTAVYTNESNSELNQKFIHDWYTRINNFISWDSKFDVVDRQGRSLLFLAAEYGQLALVKNLIDIKTRRAKGVDVDAADYIGVTPLYIAAQNGHLEVVKLLLLNGANVNAAKNDGVTPLWIAAENGHVEVVRLLLANGANVNVAMNDGCTPLFVAAANGHVEVVQLLLASGANVNAPCNDGVTPLYLAAQNGHVEMVKLLLASGANVNAPCNDGFTPLYLAAQNDHVEVVKLLLASGANVDNANKNGATPLYIAAHKGHVEMVKLLLASGANVNNAKKNDVTPLYIAAENGRLEVVKLLLASGANVNNAKKNGVTPLYIAAENGRLEVVKLLLASGANVNNAKNNGATPLYIAAKNGHLEVVKVLCEHGATIQPVDFSNNNLLTSSYQNKLIDLKKESPYLLPVTDETRVFPCIVINVSMIVVLEKHLQTLPPYQVGIKNVIRGLISLIYQHIHQPFEHHVSLQRLRSGYHYVNDATLIDELVSCTQQFQSCRKPNNTATVTSNDHSFSLFTLKNII